MARHSEDRKTLFGFFVAGAATADSFRSCAAEVEVAVHSVGVYRNEEIRMYSYMRF